MVFLVCTSSDKPLKKSINTTEIYALVLNFSVQSVQFVSWSDFHFQLYYRLQELSEVESEFN